MASNRHFLFMKIRKIIDICDQIMTKMWRPTPYADPLSFAICRGWYWGEPLLKEGHRGEHCEPVKE